MGDTSLIDYVAVFECTSTLLLARHPHEDVLGAPFPLKELAEYVTQRSLLSPTPLAVHDVNGNTFFASMVHTHTNVLFVVSRRRRFGFLNDVALALSAVIAPQAHIQQLVYHVPGDRRTKINWAQVCELVVNQPTAKGLPDVDDYSFELLMDSLAPENLILCVEALWREESVVFLSKRVNVIAPCVEALKSLIYPLVWSGVCCPLLPGEFTQRVICRQSDTPFLLGVPNLSVAEVQHALSKSNHYGVDVCLIVDLDRDAISMHRRDGKASMVDVKARIMNKHRADVAGRFTKKRELQHRIDGMRLSFAKVMLDAFHNYKPFVLSSSSSGVGGCWFDFEGMWESVLNLNISKSSTETEHKKQEESEWNLSFYAFAERVSRTRAFGDFIQRSSAAAQQTPFDRLCKEWRPVELPHAAKELLIRRYGYTEAGARAVWARVRHLGADDQASIFSAKKFRDFVATLGLDKDANPNDLEECNARLEAIVFRDSEKTCPPPLVLPTIPLVVKSTDELDFPISKIESLPLLVELPHNCEPPVRLTNWIPNRNDPVNFSKNSARLTHLALSVRPNDDELAGIFASKNPWVSVSRFLKDDESGELISKMSTSSLLGSSKWFHHQTVMRAEDVSNALFSLLMEERARSREDIRRMRESAKVTSTSSTPMISLRSDYPQSHRNSLGWSESQSDISRSPSNTALYDAQHLSESLAFAEARCVMLSSQLSEKECEVEFLTKQLESVSPYSSSAAIVRRSEPLFSQRQATTTQAIRSHSPEHLPFRTFSPPPPMMMTTPSFGRKHSGFMYNKPTPSSSVSSSMTMASSGLISPVHRSSAMFMSPLANGSPKRSQSVEVLHSPGPAKKLTIASPPPIDVPQMRRSVSSGGFPTYPMVSPMNSVEILPGGGGGGGGGGSGDGSGGLVRYKSQPLISLTPPSFLGGILSAKSSSSSIFLPASEFDVKNEGFRVEDRRGSIL